MPLQPLRSVVVTAPSRLHFGMFSFGRPDVRQFGGVGMMIQSPGLRVSLCPAECFDVGGLYAQRAQQFVARVTSVLRRDGLLIDDRRPLAARLTIECAPREHIGLGLGTQLAMSIAAAICAACNVPRPNAVQLAQMAGRGARSTVGTYGFERGGLIVEAGKRAAGEISPLLTRVALPREWRILLIMPKKETGLAGIDEQQAFSQLPPVPLGTTDRLLREAMLYLLPAAAARDFREFSESLYRFGALAGSCFASQQEGCYASAQTAALVARLRESGIQGVAQSSWGPTVFALCHDADDARQRLREVQSWLDQNRAGVGGQDYECHISVPDDEGARIDAR